MKKLLFIVAVLAISMSSFAQTSFGVKAGTNISNINMSGEGISLDTQSKTGLLIGGFANFKLSETFAIQPELLFAQYGYKLDLDLGGMTIEGEESLNYLAIPVMGKYYFGGFNIQAGPQLGFLLSAEEDADGEKTDSKDNWNGVDFGLNLGVGYDLEMGLGFDVRYNIGLSNNIAETDGTDLTVKNNAFQISLSYAF